MPNDRLRELIESDPVEAHKLLSGLKKYVMVPHSGGQAEVLNSPARFKVLNAGRRWGKTKAGVKAMLKVALKEPESGSKDKLVWWCAPTYKVVKRGYRETKRQLPRQYLTHDFPPETNFDAGRSVILHLTNGNTIEFYSAERPGGMLGEGVDFVVLDEAATMPSIVWEQTIRPTLADTKGGAMLISTPRGRNWFYKRWLDGQDPQNKNWASWTFPSRTNPHVEEEEIQAMEDELPTVLYQQEVLAKFIADGSSVFSWEDKLVQSNAIPERGGLVEGVKVRGPSFLGIDLAKTTDYTVLYGANELDLRNNYYERFNSVKWAEQKRRIKRAVARLYNAGAESVTLVIDSTGVGDPIQEDLEEAGYDVIDVNFTTFKNKMVVRLAKDLELGRAFLLQDGLVEFENYEMAATKSGKIVYSAPEGEHDDVVSAKMLQHWGLVTEGSPDVHTITAAGEEDPQDPTAYEDEEPHEQNEWSDLIDADNDEAEIVDTGVPREATLRPPTPEELLNDPAVWS